MPQDLPGAKDILSNRAIGLFQQAGTSSEFGASPVTLLNEYLRRGWEQLCYICFYAGEMPPLTIPELVKWLHCPASSWPAIGPEISRQGQDYPLLAEGTATEFCARLAEPFINSYNPRLELEDAYFRALYEACLSIGLQARYTEARTFLHHNPVLSDPYESIAANLIWNDEVRRRLMACYELVPHQCIRLRAGRAYIMRCPHCDWPLQWRGEEAFCHQGGVCADLFGDLADVGHWQEYRDSMARTKEGVQRFAIAPEVALFELTERLDREWGLSCALFPEFDAYDLHITFPGGQHWAVDMKDYRYATVLASKLTVFACYPEWDRAFYVFPDYRADQSYLNAFRNSWTPQKDVDFMSMSAFVKAVRWELER